MESLHYANTQMNHWKLFWDWNRTPKYTHGQCHWRAGKNWQLALGSRRGGCGAVLICLMDWGRMFKVKSHIWPAFCMAPAGKMVLVDEYLQVSDLGPNWVKCYSLKKKIHSSHGISFIWYPWFCFLAFKVRNICSLSLYRRCWPDPGPEAGDGSVSAILSRCAAALGGRRSFKACNGVLKRLWSQGQWPSFPQIVK